MDDSKILQYTAPREWFDDSHGKTEGGWSSMFGRQAASWSAQGYIGKLGVVTKQLSAVSNSKQEVEQDGRLHSGERPAAEHLPVHAGHHAVVGRSGGMSQ